MVPDERLPADGAEIPEDLQRLSDARAFPERPINFAMIGIRPRYSNRMSPGESQLTPSMPIRARNSVSSGGADMVQPK